MIGWLDLKGAAAYTSISIRTLRRYVTDPVHRLPVYRVGGKLVMRPDDLDQWIRGFEKGRVGVDRFVDEVLSDIHIGQRPSSKRGPDAVNKV